MSSTLQPVFGPMKVRSFTASRRLSVCRSASLRSPAAMIAA